ncbi:MAG: hypothetical protein U9P88_01090 [Patescibacteria group bacterium]|nr:hypothetical protein [Patescibacteria group bacterium]
MRNNFNYKANKKFFKKILEAIAEQAFLSCLFLFILSLFLGGIFFYRYGILIEKTEPEIPLKSVEFRTDLYQKILQEWENQEASDREADLKIYIDPFQAQGATSAPEA